MRMSRTPLRKASSLLSEGLSLSSLPASCSIRPAVHTMPSGQALQLPVKRLRSSRCHADGGLTQVGAFNSEAAAVSGGLKEASATMPAAKQEL